MKSILFIVFSYLLIGIASAQNTNISGIVNVYRKVIAVDSAKGFVKLSDASNLTQYTGNSVMIIQMKGATIDQNDASTFGNITAINEAGQFEIAKMCGQKGDSLIFENKLQNFYDPTGLVQIVIIPKYVDVTVVDTLRAKSWDPISGTGGVIAIEASGTVFANSVIYADSAGFRGGGLINHSGDCSNFVATAQMVMHVEA